MELGGGVTRSSVTTTVDNPYTITNLQYNCKVNALVLDNSYIMNMAYYASNNIPSYNAITSIPEEHSPNAINTCYAQNWVGAFSIELSEIPGPMESTLNLVSLPDPFYNTSNATNMSNIFSACWNLTTVPNFDTSNVTDMSYMFNMNQTAAPSITEPEPNLTTVPNFNTSKVTNMKGMFYNCGKLNAVPNFNTSNVTDMSHMFHMYYWAQHCKLTTVPNFDTSNVTNMSFMFFGCNNLTQLPNFDTSKVANMHGAFFNLDIFPEKWNFSNLKTLSGLFFGYKGVTPTAANFNFNMNEINSTAYMYSGVRNSFTFLNINTHLVTNMSNMYSQIITFSYNTRNDMISNLTTITIPNYDTHNVTNMQGMFENTSRFILPNNFNTNNVTDMSYMFSLDEVDRDRDYHNFPELFLNQSMINIISNMFNTAKVTNMYEMFAYQRYMQTAPNFDTSNVTDMSYMFINCRNLQTFPVYNLSSIKRMYHIFEDCANIKGNLYIESNNISSMISLFSYGDSDYMKNIYCHANSNTYAELYQDYRNTYNSKYNVYLKTMENDYAEIPWTGNGIYRFPTNKIQLMYTDNTPISVIEVSPYTDYNLSTKRNSTVTTYAPDVSSDIIHNGTIWGGYAGTIKFRFFKDIPNMTANVVDTI